MKALHLLLISAMFVLSVPPSQAFESKFKRYLSGHDLIRVLHQKFSLASFDTLSECGAIDSYGAASFGVRDALGASSPASGDPSVTGPTSAFMRWYSNCLRQYIEKDLAERKSPEESLLLSLRLQLTWQSEWTKISPEVRSKIILHLIHELVGPGIIPNESQWVGRYMTLTEKDETLGKAYARIAFRICQRDDFLSY